MRTWVSSLLRGCFLSCAVVLDSEAPCSGVPLLSSAEFEVGEMKKKLLRWFIVLTALGLGGLGLWALREFYPTHRELFPKCVFYELTGLYCPGCGSTRVLRSLLCGDLSGAWRYNPLLTLALPFFLWWIYREILWSEYRIPRPAWLMSVRFALIAAVVIAVYFVGRNLPWPPFCYLAPPPD